MLHSSNKFCHTIAIPSQLPFIIVICLPDKNEPEGSEGSRYRKKNNVSLSWVWNFAICVWPYSLNCRFKWIPQFWWDWSHSNYVFSQNKFISPYRNKDRADCIVSVVPFSKKSGHLKIKDSLQKWGYKKKLWEGGESVVSIALPRSEWKK